MHSQLVALHANVCQDCWVETLARRRLRHNHIFLLVWSHFGLRPCLISLGPFMSRHVAIDYLLLSTDWSQCWNKRRQSFGSHSSGNNSIDWCPWAFPMSQMDTKWVSVIKMDANFLCYFSFALSGNDTNHKTLTAKSLRLSRMFTLSTGSGPCKG